MNRRSSCIFRIAVIAVMWIPLHASAQLTLDNFTSGAYTKHLNTGPQTDLHYAKLAPGSLLGAARQADFSIGPNYYDQGATLSIGKGIGFWTPVSAPPAQPTLLTELLSPASRHHWVLTSADIPVSN
jgi:hypothetical protein